MLQSATAWAEMKELFITDLGHIGIAFARIVVAYLLALPIGWERERELHGIGIRTFPLVAMASCGFVLIGVTLSPADTSGTSRIIQGLIAGIGFIGGGAILKDGGSVRGTATAASIWNMGVMGAAVAQGRIDIGILLTLLNFFTLRVLAPWKKRLDDHCPEPERQ